jgi:predicted Zn-dependent protease with MMP-like domain
MEKDIFERIVAEELQAVPQKIKDKIKNVAFIIEDEPSQEVRRAQGLRTGDLLLGLYQGIPNTVRGGEYGIGMTLPDSITLYRLPILKEAGEDEDSIRKVIRETVWHEIAHYFGFDEWSVEDREDRGTNEYT